MTDPVSVLGQEPSWATEETFRNMEMPRPSRVREFARSRDKNLAQGRHNISVVGDPHRADARLRKF